MELEGSDFVAPSQQVEWKERILAASGGSKKKRGLTGKKLQIPNRARPSLAFFRRVTRHIWIFTPHVLYSV